MSTVEFKLPELGEGVEAGTVVKLLVAAGDTVTEGQALLEVEIDKATVELESPAAGTLASFAVSEGDEVPVGALLLTIEASGASAAPKPEPKAESTPEPRASGQDQSLAETQATPRPKRAQATTATRRPAAPGVPAPAGPAVRRLARMLGVDLGSVRGSGERGRVTYDDVHAHVQNLAAGNGAGRPSLPALPDFSKWGPVDVEPLTVFRKRTAEAMERSWSAIPHVTQNDLADITDLEASRKAYRKAHPEVKLTMTVLVAKACAVALKSFPDVNSTLDLRSGTQILKRYFHIGIAVDTPYGLLVPVLKDVDQKPMVQLADELTDLATRTRDKKVKPDELRGASFTVSNLGGIGGTGFTPIVNWPQVAILGVSRGRWTYEVGPEGPIPRLLMPLSLSYDHRVIDGAQAARFTRRVCELLSSPTELLVEV